jgi:hypothetical protein
MKGVLFMDIMSCKEAKAAGLKRYFTAKPCPKGHVAERFVSTNGCCACALENNKRPENQAAIKRWKESAHGKAKSAEAVANWQVKNADKVKATQKRYYDKNRAARIALSKEVQARDPEKKRERMRSWQKKNPEKCVQHAQKRYATERLSATYIDSERPFIRLMYEMGRELGLAVDHIIPQTHKDVTGLHCLLNLRLLGPIKNMSKSNRFDPERALMCEPF